MNNYFTTVAPYPLFAAVTAAMSWALVTLFLSTTTVAVVLVAAALETPSTSKSAACTLGGHEAPHLSPVRARFTVSTFASLAIGFTTGVAVVLQEVTPKPTQASIKATVLSNLVVCFIIVFVIGLSF